MQIKIIVLPIHANSMLIFSLKKILDFCMVGADEKDMI